MYMSDQGDHGGVGRSPLLGELHMTCDAHFRTRTRDDVCEHVCEVS